MSENKKSVFRKESLDRIDSPDKLDQYVKVSKSSAWLFVFGSVIALIALVIWGFVGTLPRSITTKGISMSNGLIVTYIDPAGIPSNLIDCPVRIELPDNTTVEGEVTKVSDIPYSEEEVTQVLVRDWIIDQIFTTSYAYQVDISTESNIPDDVLVTTVITYEEVRPIEYLLN